MSSEKGTIIPMFPVEPIPSGQHWQSWSDIYFAVDYAGEGFFLFRYACSINAWCLLGCGQEY